jgi:hypothetical protein
VTRPNCWRCGVVLRPAVAVVSSVPVCRDHSRELVRKPEDLKIAPLASDAERLGVWR